MATALMATYSRLPVSFERGEGVWLWDTEGRRYLDALSGIAVCGLGHAHPEVTRALCEQARRLVHTSNLYGIPVQERLGERLVAVCGMERAFFCNSGAEANEAAFKLARLWGHRRGIGAPEIVVAEGSFHGRTLATLSATGNRKVQAGFEPLVSGFVRVPYGDIGALETVARNRPAVAAVHVEPIQGEGGIVVPPEDYLARLRTLCDANGWLLMLDEVQSGNGRTGRWCAWQHHDARPDVLTLAKGLGNGVPIGACLASGPAAELFAPGSHGSTFGGNALACNVALSVIDTIERDGLLERAAAMGRRLRQGLEQALGGVRGVREIRGLGLMIGVELERPCAELVRAALERGLLINVTAERVVRLLPPLVIGESEVDEIVRVLGEIVREHLARG